MAVKPFFKANESIFKVNESLSSLMNLFQG